MSHFTIWGAGGHGKVVLGIARGTGRYPHIRFIDDDPSKTGCLFCGCPVESASAHPEYDSELIVAIGPNHIRALRYQAAWSWKTPLATLVHRAAVLDDSARIGAGTVVMAGAVINADAQIGADCIINSGAIVEHDCVIGDHCHISPGAVLGGEVRVAPYAHIGIGAVILPGVQIGEGAVVGGGAAVIHSVEPYTTVVGVPARSLSSKAAREKLPALVETLC